jgi:hypothetical protein
VSDFEKLGAFYLGRGFDPEKNADAADPLMYDSRDLTTHAVCVGMTGSGKTGLCISLIEEAALDGIPAIVIDPKGDIANLMLTFPGLTPAEFEPWIDAAEAARKGTSPEELAAQTAATWKKGLADWGQDGDRIRRLREAADVAIYTPGSNAGLQLSILRSFAPAAGGVAAADPAATRDRIAAAVAGLLGLVGIAADPLKSREHILLSAIVDNAWNAGHALDLAGLIGAIQKPPFDKVGVFDVDTFYPAKERLELAMAINNLLALVQLDAQLPLAGLRRDEGSRQGCQQVQPRRADEAGIRRYAAWHRSRRAHPHLPGRFSQACRHLPPSDHVADLSHGSAVD